MALLLASCASDESLAPVGPEVADSGGVRFNIEGLASGSTQTRAAIAVAAENEIKTLDIYVFAYDDDTDPQTEPAAPPADIDESKWYLRETWRYNEDNPTSVTGDIEKGLHAFTLGGKGTARTAVIYPKKGRYLRFFMVANAVNPILQGEWNTSKYPYFVTTANSGTRATLTIPTASATDYTGVTTADQFLKLSIQLSQDPDRPGGIGPILCPLPMTAQMESSVGGIVDIKESAPAPTQQTLGVTLKRSVARFDVVNNAVNEGNDNQSGFELKTIAVHNAYNYIQNTGIVPDDAGFIMALKQEIDPTTWINTGGVDEHRTKTKLAAFYTSPTLAGEATPMIISLYGEVGPILLNQDVKVEKPNGTKIEVEANTRYVLNIQRKIDGALATTFNIIDWNSDVLTPQLDDDTRMPDLTVAAVPGLEYKIEWNGPQILIDYGALKTHGIIIDIKGGYDQLNRQPSFLCRIAEKEEVRDENGNWKDLCWIRGENPMMPLYNENATAEVCDLRMIFEIALEADIPLRDRKDVHLVFYNVAHPEKYVIVTVKRKEN